MNVLQAEMRSRWNSDGWHYDDTDAHGIRHETERIKWRSLLLGFPKGTKLLDAGTGTGFVALIAAEQGLDTTGVDWSETMLAQAREKAAAQNLEVRFVPGEMENLPFEDNSFQALTARHVLWTLIEPVRVFREWQRVLLPGGSVFADYTPRKGDRHIGRHYSEETEQKLPLNRDVSPEEIGGLFREGGFTGVSFGVQEEEVKHEDHTHIKKAFLFTCIK
ncbi:MAG: class I SAM-dependent methyltransferase [Treponema sp.]|jgi:ubiquinone/menaquinone biosynthesis C-methylase UbiE|nr:class I SAM-dependent methyltransferase [Treponema sp.]